MTSPARPTGSTRATPRGEYVVVLDGAADDDGPTTTRSSRCCGARSTAGDSRRDAVDAVATSTGVARNRVYELALTIPTS